MTTGEADAGSRGADVRGDRDVREVESSPVSAHHLSAGAVATLLVLCLIWGANLITIKIVNRGFDPIFAAAVRSAAGSLVIFAYAAVRGRSLRLSRPAFAYAAWIAVFFGMEFLFLFWAMDFTLASRGMILLYTTPFWVALGAHFMLKERLTVVRVVGLVLAFGGVAAVLGADTGQVGPEHWLGDIMAVVAALFWAGNTLYGKRSMTRSLVNPLQLMFYQLLLSTPLLLVASLIFEGVPHVEWRLDSMLALTHQTVIVATTTYLIWFVLLARYQSTHMAAFSFVTPLFGVVMAWLFLSEPVSWLLLLSLAMVVGGIYLVNRR